MNKIKKFLLLSLILLISVFAYNVKADMGAPQFREIELVVINPDGVDYYDYNNNFAGHLDKDDIVYITYEMDNSYSIGKKVSESGYEYISSIGYISKLDGFSIVQEEVDPTKLEDDYSITKLDSKETALVVNEDGVDIYKGPASLYDKVGHINKGTELTYEYGINGEGGITHIYVNYKGKKGWVEVLKGAVYLENKAQYVSFSDITLSCGVMPKGSIITPKYKTDSWTHKVLIEYNGCELLHNTLKDQELVYIYPVNYTVSNDITVYKTPDTSSDVLTTIKADSDVIVIATTEPMLEDKDIKFVKYGDITGYVLDSDSSFTYKSNVEEEIKIDDTVIKKEEPKEDKKEEKTDNKKENKKFEISLKEIIILCVAFAVLLIVTAVVVIILINKKSKEKAVVTETDKKKEEK